MTSPLEVWGIGPLASTPISRFPTDGSISLFGEGPAIEGRIGSAPRAVLQGRRWTRAGPARGWGRRSRSLPIVLAVAVAGLIASPAPGLGQAEEDGVRGWLDLGLGGGMVRLSGSSHESAFGLDFEGGMWLSRRLGLGVRLGGWTIEGFNLWNPEKGESISEVFAVLAFRPKPGHPLSFTVESGLASYTVNDPALFLGGGDGLGWRVTGSWRFLFSEHLALTPSVVQSWGRINPDVRGQEGFEYSGAGILLRFGWAW